MTDFNPCIQGMTYPFGPAPEGVDVLWRVEARSYSTIVDAEREIYGSTMPRLEMTWWIVTRRTPKGARLDTGTFVKLTAHKRFACNTPDEAVQSFRARKTKQIRILRDQLSRAEYELALLKEEDKCSTT